MTTSFNHPGKHGGSPTRSQNGNGNGHGRDAAIGSPNAAEAARRGRTDEKLLDDLYELARRLDDRLCTIERIMTAENPEWRQQCLPSPTAQIADELEQVRGRSRPSRSRIPSGE